MNIKQIGSDIEPVTLSDEELVMAHMTVHAYYKEFRDGREKEGWTLEEVVQKHDEIKQEMDNREETEHEYISGLDNESVSAHQMDVQMGHREDVAKEWVDTLLQADDIEQHVRKEPPQADWYSKAHEFLQDEDSSIDLSEYVSFSAQSYDTVDEGVQEWVQDATDDEVGVVGYHLNEDTETGILFVKQEDEYAIYADNTELVVTQSQTEALDVYNEATELAQGGARFQFILNEINQQEEWAIPDSPEEYDMMEPGTDWSQIDTSEEAYLKAEGSDADSWEDASEEVRQAITSYHSASASGSPAQSFEDLWGPHHAPGGEMSYNGLVQAKLSNSGVEDSPETPANIRDDIESHLNSHIEQYADEYDDIEGPDQISQAHHKEDEMESSTKGSGDRSAYRWYVWDEGEAEAWLEGNGFMADEMEREANFAVYNQPDEELFDMWLEWRGPPQPDWKHAPSIDGRPVLFELGYVNEEPSGHMYDEVGINAIKFQVEAPPDLQVSQMQVLENDMDFYWYQWSTPEVEVWLNEREYEPQGRSTEGGFHTVKLTDAEQYETIHRAWEGERSYNGDDMLAGGQKPRRVVYGEYENGDKEPHAIEFLIGSP